MRNEPTPAQKMLLGVVGVVASAALGLWLMFTYFSIWTSDTKVSVDLPELTDAIGPSAKVRYHGIIVGRVLTLKEHGDGYRVEIVVGEEHAESIPPTATARILPSTFFGSEYVELMSPRDATEDDHLESGDVLQADRSGATLRLMDSFDAAERLVSAIDAEDVNRITGTLAPALDGHGDDIKSFLERTDAVVTDLNADLPTTWETLAMLPQALDTLADIEPDLTASLESSQTTAKTLAEREKQLGEALAGSSDVVARGDELFARNKDVIVPFVGRLERLTGLAADHTTEIRAILVNFARTGNNGAKGVDDNAIQMIGTIGIGLPHLYTAADCVTYGSTMLASNCGDPVPTTEPGAGHSSAGIDDVGSRLADLVGGAAGADRREGAGASAPGPEATPEDSQPPTLVDLLGGLLGGGR